jgi:ribosomal protein S18 acetylase RimI-like enzyme
MNVRRLREDEIPALVDDLWHPFAREMADLDSYNALVDRYDELDDDAREDALAYRREQYRNDDHAIFVADRDGDIVGCAYVKDKETPPVFARGAEANISEVYVAPDYRENGLASDLLDRAEAWAADRDCEYVTLSVNAGNGIARRVYESRGYETRRHKMDKRLE